MCVLFTALDLNTADFHALTDICHLIMTEKTLPACRKYVCDVHCANIDGQDIHVAR